MKSIKTCEIKRCLPSWARVVKTVNSTPIYNMNVFENIMSWNADNLDTPAFDYFGSIITYKELPDRVNEYVCAFRSIGIEQGKVVTLCMPVSVENMLSLLALDCIGAISNNVNYLFLKSDFAYYTEEKGSDVLVILDAFLPSVIDELESSQIKTVVVTSLTDLLPTDCKNPFADLGKLPKKLREVFDNPVAQAECIQKIAGTRHIRFIRLPDLIQVGKNRLQPLFRGPIDAERDICYSYTSGTTGRPKCIVYKEFSTTAFLEMHAGVDTKDFVGERVLQIVPLTHATGERVSGYLPLAKGKTLVPYPIYDKDSFAKNLVESRCNWVVAAPSFYLAAVAQGDISPNALKHLTRPSSGGEPVTNSNVKMIDNWLLRNGCHVRFAIGGGAAEDGSGALFTYFMDEKTKTNETGMPLEPAIKAKIVDENGLPVAQGERGILHISSPAAADRYLFAPEATNKRWYVDDQGLRWGITGDIAVQNPDGSYSILGRASDSYTDKDGMKKYLFDIEYSLELTEPILEWEISAHETSSGTFVVGQIVLKDDVIINLPDLVERVCKKYNLFAVKFYPKFEISETTGKRNYQLLRNDKSGYYAPCDQNHLFAVSFDNATLRMEQVNKAATVFFSF